MPKSKEQKKKDRERRVAQKKLAEAQKRAQDQSAAEPQQAFPKKNVFTNAVAAPKTKFVAANTKKPFNYRRSGG